MKNRNELIIEALQVAKLHVLSFDHAFKYNNSVYYKMIDSDKTHYKTTYIKDLNYFDSFEKKNKSIYLGGVILNLEFDFGGYNVPGNTFFIDELINSLKGKKRTNWKNYSEVEVDTKFTEIGILTPSDLQVIKLASAFNGVDTLRPQLECVRIEDRFIYSTDAHKLIKRPVNCEVNISINKAGQKFLGTCKKPVTIFESAKSYRFECDGKNVTVDKVDGSWPVDQTNNLLKKINQFSAIVTRVDLINAIKQIEKSSNQSSHLIRLEFKKDLLKLIAQDLDFGLSSTSSVYIENSNFLGAIGFNSKNLLICLNALDSDTVSISLSHEDRQVKIEDIIIMPMMLYADSDNPDKIRPIDQINPTPVKSEAKKLAEEFIKLRNSDRESIPQAKQTKKIFTSEVKIKGANLPNKTKKQVRRGEYILREYKVKKDIYIKRFELVKNSSIYVKILQTADRFIVEFYDHEKEFKTFEQVETALKKKYQYRSELTQ